MQDILDASDQILEIVGTAGLRGQGSLQATGGRAPPRNIGECANSLSDDFRAQYPGIAWRDIIGLRVVLAHHYHRVDPNQVWVIAEIEVERLAERLRTKMA